MSTIARTLAPRLADQIPRLRDRTLLEGAMATSALVAMADRRILLEEDLALGALLENVELLRLYDPHLAVALHSSFVDRIRRDFDGGKQAALEAIARCSEDVEAAELLVKVGIAIAKADQDFSDDEVCMVEEICAQLGIAGLDPLALASGTGRRLPRPD